MYFLKGVAPGRSAVLQLMAAHPWGYEDMGSEDWNQWGRRRRGGGGQ